MKFTTPRNALSTLVAVVLSISMSACTAGSAISPPPVTPSTATTQVRDSGEESLVAKRLSSIGFTDPKVTVPSHGSSHNEPYWTAEIGFAGCDNRFTVRVLQKSNPPMAACL